VASAYSALQKENKTLRILCMDSMQLNEYELNQVLEKTNETT
jgi:hypothetical protein